jgi:hypothetical protein
LADLLWRVLNGGIKSGDVKWRCKSYINNIRTCNLANLQLSTVGDHNWFEWLIIFISVAGFNLFDDVHSFNNLAKDNYMTSVSEKLIIFTMVVIQPIGLDSGDEELIE